MNPTGQTTQSAVNSLNCEENVFISSANVLCISCCFFVNSDGESLCATQGLFQNSCRFTTPWTHVSYWLILYDHLRFVITRMRQTNSPCVWHFTHQCCLIRIFHPFQICGTWQRRESSTTIPQCLSVQQFLCKLREMMLLRSPQGPVIGIIGIIWICICAWMKTELCEH